MSLFSETCPRFVPWGETQLSLYYGITVTLAYFLLSAMFPGSS
jgi:hypothetical protein